MTARFIRGLGCRDKFDQLDLNLYIGHNKIYENPHATLEYEQTKRLLSEICCLFSFFYFRGINTLLYEIIFKEDSIMIEKEVLVAEIKGLLMALEK